MYPPLRENAGKAVQAIRRLPFAPLLREAPVLIVCYLAYSLSKDIIHESPVTVAFRNAWDLAHFEATLGIFREAGLQRWFLDHARPVVYFTDWFYTIGYWPVVLPTAIILWWKRRDVYSQLRNVALVAFVIVLVVYAVYPLAPPRMLPGFANTLLGLPFTGHALSSTDGSGLLANQYAATPSVHYGLAVIAAIAMFRSGALFWKIGAVLYQATMALTILLTANHYFMDISAAVGVVGLAFLCNMALNRLAVLALRARSRPVAIGGRQVAERAPG